ncbi:MAG: hypothetical protein ACI9OJ_001630 [Myxococcota bacterium]|jgi:hypothetical protein
MVSSGCAWLQSSPHSRSSSKKKSAKRSPQPEAPATSERPFSPESNESDLVFVRTGDRKYYYIIDKARSRCFFHAPLYGRKHLAPIKCDSIPEYADLMGEHGHEHPSEEPASEETPAEQPVANSGEPVPDDEAAHNDAMDSFRRAWIQKFCAARAGYEEPQTVLLSRHGLSIEQWDQFETDFKGDPDAWSALQQDADSTCPE